MSEHLEWTIRAKSGAPSLIFVYDGEIYDLTSETVIDRPARDVLIVLCEYVIESAKKVEK